LNIVIVGGGPTGLRDCRRGCELYRADFAKDFKSIPQSRRA
jgi:hypothetical protein